VEGNAGKRLVLKIEEGTAHKMLSRKKKAAECHTKYSKKNADFEKRNKKRYHIKREEGGEDLRLEMGGQRRSKVGKKRLKNEGPRITKKKKRGRTPCWLREKGPHVYEWGNK